ncbi:multidrug transporter [Marinobacter qingdaonensis]|uniref:Multidrug transporter n=1 Tax=Marinobacter qingdaonensis TaxID=3108486 RepID=A0ABU5P1V2_9GAMM|nr:multidrug transporter [Marinobacter sp. ASW11-75]MEA1081952.1 multidrug transporter [Marinobacter sp. ASW11-75]
MSHDLATMVLGAFGALLVILGLLFFLRPRWLLGWLKGMAVFAIIVFGLYSLVIAVNVAGYQSLAGMQTVATISIQRQGEQVWLVTMKPRDDKNLTETLRGDQWQLDARIIRFSGPLRWLGIAPGYRLERLGGRYTSLEQERTAPRTIIGLGDRFWLDLWELDREFNMPFVEGVYGNATFMPMRDGAVFDVRLSASGLVAVPMNEQAREAVERWDE